MTITGTVLAGTVMAFALTGAEPPVEDGEAPVAPETQPVEEGQDDQEAQEEQAPPSLDDLLGIDGDDQDRGAGDAAARDSQAELQRELDEAGISDAFELAIEKMSLSAEMLDVRFDAGIGTQRVQEEILSRLQHLIEQARKMSQMSASSSTSRGGDPSQPNQSPGQRQDGERSAGEERNPVAQDSQPGDPPPRQDGEINTVLDESRTEWGNLPERYREMMSQGKIGRYSSLYRKLTEAYYQSLAEEGSP